MPVAETELERRRAALKELVARKEALEAEIKELIESLDIQKVGMHAPLVDREGFPLADIDLHSVRATRQRVIMLQNDHKGLMTEVEGALHRLHEEAKRAGPAQAPEGKTELPKAFAKINSVSEGSPAAHAGLKVGDQVVSFGSVNAQNYNGLQAVASVVSNSVERPLDVTVLRADRPERLLLTPRKWAGQGLLGCHIVPL